jgi:hypothetical protein
VTNIYKTQYAPSEINNSIIEDDYLNDSLFQHIYKKRYIDSENELDQYFKASLAPPKTDILEWWKVKLLLYIFFILY